MVIIICMHGSEQSFLHGLLALNSSKTVCGMFRSSCEKSGCACVSKMSIHVFGVCVVVTVKK